MQNVGTVGMVDSLTIGGRTFTDLTNLISLVGNVTSGAFTTLRKLDATSGYTPSGSNKFKVHAIKMFLVNASAASNSSLNLGYGDTDSGVGGGAPTTPKYVGNDATNAHIFPIPWVGTANGPIQDTFELAYGQPFTIPNTKFPFVTGNAVQAQVIIYGYEVP